MAIPRIYNRKTKRVISPENYLKLIATPKGKESINSAKFQPPKIGDKHFGYFIVELNTKTIEV